jgi:RNA polymerase sigma factor (TIGR02999 family)
VPLSDNVTAWLIRWNDGDQAALQALTPLVYAEMHRLAAGYLRSERIDHTLQATALVHEAYLQVRKLDRIEWKSKAHFIGIAAQVMRRILVDHARTRNAHKRGGLQERLSIEAFDVAAPLPAMDLTALDQALDRFAKEYPRQARVVELRFFGGGSPAPGCTRRWPRSRTGGIRREGDRRIIRACPGDVGGRPCGAIAVGMRRR